MKLHNKYKTYMNKHRVNRNISYEVHIEPDEYKEERILYLRGSRSNRFE
jgi:hypothetical protein